MEFVASHSSEADQLLPLLHWVTQRHGHVPPSLVPEIAEALNISRADVHGVISFYDDYGYESIAAEVQVCGAEACQALGCEDLIRQVRRHVSGDVHVREVYCLGNCTVGPNVRIGERIMGRATLERVAQALEALDAD